MSPQLARTIPLKIVSVLGIAAILGIAVVALPKGTFISRSVTDLLRLFGFFVVLPIALWRLFMLRYWAVVVVGLYALALAMAVLPMHFLPLVAPVVAFAVIFAVTTIIARNELKNGF